MHSLQADQRHVVPQPVLFFFSVPLSQTVTLNSHCLILSQSQNAILICRDTSICLAIKGVESIHDKVLLLHKKVYVTVQIF